MAKPTIEYDANLSTYWVHWNKVRGQTLLGRSELQPWIDALIDGTCGKGKQVRTVNFVFKDEAAAAYNHDSLKFARINTFLADKPPRPFSPAGGGPAFDVRQDAGIK